MNKLTIAKKLVSTVVGIGTGIIVKGIIENNTDTTTALQKVTVASASTVIGFAAADAVTVYTDSKIDELVALWKKVRSTNPE